MSTLIEQLEEMAKKDTRVRAVLKRSLSFDPGTYPPVFAYVEPRVHQEENHWRRTIYYLVAGLWALNSQDNPGYRQSLPSACGMLYISNDKAPSIEKRFIALLDADEGQLSYRLRQMVALLKDFSINFDELLNDLVSWNHPEKFIQVKWAKTFYHNEMESDNKPETSNIKEI